MWILERDMATCSSLSGKICMRQSHTITAQVWVPEWLLETRCKLCFFCFGTWHRSFKCITLCKFRLSNWMCITCSTFYMLGLMGAFMGLILTIIAECLLQLCIYLFIYLFLSLPTYQCDFILIHCPLFRAWSCSGHWSAEWSKGCVVVLLRLCSALLCYCVG